MRVLVVREKTDPTRRDKRHPGTALLLHMIEVTNDYINTGNSVCCSQQTKTQKKTQEFYTSVDV
jgi:hypothetical protein